MSQGSEDRPESSTPEVVTGLLDSIFGLTAAGTTVRRELLGGVTTFLTMAYIVVVNPAILAEAGVPFDGALFATCISAAVATLAMGLWAGYPIALAPGMGLNAYFTYVAVRMLIDRYGHPPDQAWRVALGAVFLSGVLFLVLSLFKVRAAIVDAVPRCLKLAVAAGIGMFISFIGLQKSGIVAPHPVTFVTLGDLTSVPAISAVAAILVAGVLLCRGVRGSILAGISVAVLIHLFTGAASLPDRLVSIPDASSSFLALRPLAAIETGFLMVLFVFLFVDLFDTVGTLIAVGEHGGFMDDDGKLPRAGRCLQADALGTLAGSLLGTSTVTSYIESTAGIASGARTGLANIPVAVLFCLCIPFSPFLSAVPETATAPALVIVGALMITALGKINWKDHTEGLPAFLCFVAIPFTFSISDGIAAGFLSYPIMKVAAGRGREVSALVWVLFAMFLLRYVIEGLSAAG